MACAGAGEDAADDSVPGVHADGAARGRPLTGGGAHVGAVLLDQGVCALGAPPARCARAHQLPRGQAARPQRGAAPPLA